MMFGAAVKFRAGGRLVGERGRRAAQAVRSPFHPRFTGRPHGLNAHPGTLSG